MKRLLWWILGILLSPIALFLILTVLIYLPPIQNWAVDKVAAIASEKTGMQISVGHVNLSFPLDMGIDRFRMVSQEDTIADVERLVVDVKFWPLLQKKVVISELEVNNTRFNTNGFVEAAKVKGDFKKLSLNSKGIDLDKQTVKVNGTLLEGAHIDVALNDSVPKDTTKTETPWVIHADKVTIERSDIALHMPGDTTDITAHIGTLTAQEALIDLKTETYTVGSVDWANGELTYDQKNQPPVEGLDVNHIQLTHINIGIDSIYFHDPTLRMHMRQMAMREKSGLQIAELSGPLRMENGSIKVPKLKIITPESDVAIELDMPLSLADSIDPGKMRLKLEANIGKKDLMPFMAALPEAFRQSWPDRPMNVRGSVSGNMQHMDFKDLELTLPQSVYLKATGFAANLNDPQHLLADVQFTANTEQISFLNQLLPRNMQRDYRIPNGIKAEGRVKAEGATYMADITAREGRGSVKVKGQVNTDAMRYDAKVNIRNLNIHHFMPRDSIYTISADISAKGQGSDFLSPRTMMKAETEITQLRYGQWNLDNIRAQAEVKNGHAYTDVISYNNLLQGNLSIDALMNTKKLSATVVADVRRLDLYKMQVVDEPLAVRLCGHFDVTSDMKLTHYVSGLISDLAIRDSSETHRSEFVGLHLNSSKDTTIVRAQSGDLIIKLDGSGDYMTLSKKLQILVDSAIAQYDHKVIDQPALRRLLPNVKLHIESKQQNPIFALLKSQKIDYKDLLFDMSSSEETGLNGNGHVHSLTYSGVRLDTINFRLTQRPNMLSFGGQISNNKRNPQFVFNALFDGVLQERGVTFGVRYFDAENKMGARIGAQVEMVDSGLRMHLVPERPTLGYKVFTVNKDNYLLLPATGKIKAKIDFIADDKTGVKLYSEESDSTALQDMTLSLNRINLDEVTSVIPYAPRIEGLLNGDYHVIMGADKRISVVSDMAVRGLTYEHCPIGNISTELSYLMRNDSSHVVEARWLKDEEEIALLEGTYYDVGKGSIDAKLTLTRTPLSIGNGFVPDQIIGLEGYGDGVRSVKGPTSALQVNGEVMLDSARLVSVPYGTSMRFENKPIRITNSKLLFDSFNIYAMNENPLTLQGNIDFSNTDNITTDLRVRARNYQIIGAKENTKSVAYGKAFVNVFTRIQGPLENLYVRGRLDVLPSTDMHYVLRDSPLTTDNELDNLVKFTDFTDTTQVVVERPSINGLRMEMTVNISNGAHIKAWLNTDHSNYVDLMGGGTLRMTYTPADALRMTGRYTLSNGEMKYSLPIIPLKTFTIQDGSYIEFTGDLMNPTLNITATERTKSSVGNGQGVGRTVEFDCGVIITRNLNDMGLEFTIDAPEDMQLHSELQSLGVEQRSKLAVAMLTTGIYLDKGDTGDFTMNSALSSFLNSGINSITGTALRTLDLSFGMDNTTDASGETHTDYSFKFAKRFLNNRLNLSVGGKVSTGAEIQDRNDSFFDNVSLEYRLDDNATKYVNFFFQNNAYDWLDGYTQKYGAGFIWRRSVQHFLDIFKKRQTLMPLRTNTTLQRNDTTKIVTPEVTPMRAPQDSLNTRNHAK